MFSHRSRTGGTTNPNDTLLNDQQKSPNLNIINSDNDEEFESDHLRSGLEKNKGPPEGSSTLYVWGVNDMGQIDFGEDSNSFIQTP